MASSDGCGEAVGALRLLPALSGGCCLMSGVCDRLLGFACTPIPSLTVSYWSMLLCQPSDPHLNPYLAQLFVAGLGSEPCCWALPAPHS